jgi:hypothetical protein
MDVACRNDHTVYFSPAQKRKEERKLEIKKDAKNQ